MKIESIASKGMGSARIVITLNNGATVYYISSHPMAAYIPDKGYYRVFYLKERGYKITHRYMKEWLSKECNVLDDEEMETLVNTL